MKQKWRKRAQLEKSYKKKKLKPESKKKSFGFLQNTRWLSRRIRKNELLKK